MCRGKRKTCLSLSFPHLSSGASCLLLGLDMDGAVFMDMEGHLVMLHMPRPRYFGAAISWDGMGMKGPTEG